MTTYLTYSVILAVLNTWNAVRADIAQPTIEDGNKSYEGDLNSIVVFTFPGKAFPITTGTNTKDRIRTEFKFEAKAANETDANKYLDEIRTLFNVAITNGWRRIIEWDEDYTTDFFTWQIIGKEVLNDF